MISLYSPLAAEAYKSGKRPLLIEEKRALSVTCLLLLP